jgi:hypothetical protein
MDLQAASRHDKQLARRVSLLPQAILAPFGHAAHGAELWAERCAAALTVPLSEVNGTGRRAAESTAIKPLPGVVALPYRGMGPPSARGECALTRHKWHTGLGRWSAPQRSPAARYFC